jgi:BirA family biotin operon repressor/biotin-[acetyl-CoA-carboxylase] ligase
VGSTNAQARKLAERGAPHGTTVTAAEQSAGRGRQGRTWATPPGQALLLSVIIRNPPRLLPLVAGVAVAQEAGDDAQVKWPNDVLLDGRKVAGILVEARPQDGWAVVGIGVNVAVRMEDLSAELAERAGSLGRTPEEIEPTLARLLVTFDGWLRASRESVLGELRRRDALLGHPVHWQGGNGEGADAGFEGVSGKSGARKGEGAGGEGEARKGEGAGGEGEARKGEGAGIADDGRLLVLTADGHVALEAAEVHLG